MRTAMRVLTMALSGWLTAGAGAQAAETNSPHVTVGLFKNGLAVVRREFVLPAGTGEIRIDQPPVLVHGTFHIEGDVPFRARVETGEVRRAVGSLSNFRDLTLLAGREVSLTLRDRQPPVVAGILLPAGTPSDAAAPDFGGTRYSVPYGASSAVFPSTPPGLIAIRSGAETVFVDPNAILSASVKGEAGPLERIERKPVLVITPEKGKPARRCVVSYIAQGAAWAPGYQVELLDKRRLRVAQDAVVRSEMMALDDAEVFLITGYPNIEFGHVRSPLSPDVSWTAFLQQAGRSPQDNPFAGANYISQQAIYNNAAPDDGGAALPAAPTGEGPDIHWQPAGRLNLPCGGSMSMRVASADTDYEQVVEWEVSDRRDERGRYGAGRDAGRDKIAESPWDSIRFANPFPFPMTTAPVLVSEKERALGQSLSFWTRPGEKTLVRVNRALSVRVRQEEMEEPGERPVVWVAGNDYQKCGVKASLSVVNGRKEKIHFLLRRNLSGDVVSADGAPADRLLEEGIWSVNARHALTWEFDLAPGETRQIGVRYTVLIDR